MTTRLPRTLATRLTLLYAAIFVSLSAIAFFVAYTWIAIDLDARIDADLRDDIVEFSALQSAEGTERLTEEIAREAATDISGSSSLRLYSINGRPVFRAAPALTKKTLWTDRDFADVATGAGPVFRTATRQTDGEDMRVVLGPVGNGLVIEIGESLAERDEVLDLLLGTFTIIIGPVILIATLAGWLMSKTALQGVEAVTRAAEDVAQGHFDRQVLVGDRGQEIDRLVYTFNVMVDRIRALMLEMRVMTDNIAHDLKSPLTRLRATVEGTLVRAESPGEYRAASEQILGECDRLLQMIDTTLDVAEAEGDASTLVKKEVDLEQLIHEAVDLFGPVAEDRQIDISVRLDSDCRVYGNLQYLQRMLANLVDNALKYTPAGGAVSIEMSRSNGFVTISVSDTGVGIDPKDQTRIFDRFFRCDESRSKEGFGLGLSFVRAVAQAHQGKVEVRSAVSAGSRFFISLPVLSPPS